ncbi:MAG: four helix bundle protein [Vicinamibacterales bacterium]
MNQIKSHTDLEAWQVGMEMVTGMYKVTARFPGEERYGLTAQIRRAAVSVPSNVAAGQGRGAGRGTIHFLRIALGSLAEVDTQLEIAIRLGFVPASVCEDVRELMVSTGKLVSGLRRAKLRRLGLSVSAALAISALPLWRLLS